LHCTAPDAASTDWARILAHYDLLLGLKSSPIVELNRVVAVAHAQGPQSGLDALHAIEQTDRIDSLHLFHAVAGELHTRLNNHREAAESYRRALAFAQVGPEQTHLASQLEHAESVR
jgi:predicted RNA polymerase sigma factor